MRFWKGKRPWTAEPRAALVLALGAMVIGLSLLPEAHSAARQLAVGLEIGLAGVVLILAVVGAALRVWRHPG
jgi:hypothetical protein